VEDSSLKPPLFCIKKAEPARHRVERSLFCGEVFPIANAEDVGKILGAVRKRFPDATHRPYAYRLLSAGHIDEHSSDDGEPAGTAGQPVLEALRKANLINALLVVTRYFGGKKLGIPRLRQSFAQSAKMAIDAATVGEVRLVRLVELRFPFDALGPVRVIIQRYNGNTAEQHFGEGVMLRVGFPADVIDCVERRLREVLQGRGEVRLLEGESLAGS
jgi:uncharacterized YigZ family protein